ncbi:SANT/Myb_domain [Hexamita inflata]|uniref:SANT/Myb domain n=1 Tax=Hexamita inflata TaxID=28002 RepID=A0AA86TH32_9EUKA|nr:SANT/Myb domain [Hexamita inflata]
MVSKTKSRSTSGSCTKTDNQTKAEVMLQIAIEILETVNAASLERFGWRCALWNRVPATWNQSNQNPFTLELPYLHGSGRFEGERISNNLQFGKRSIARHSGIYLYINILIGKLQTSNRATVIPKRQTCIVAWNCISSRSGAKCFSHHTVLFSDSKEIQSESGIPDYFKYHMRRLQSKRSGINFLVHTYLLNKPKYHKITVFTETKLLTIFLTKMIIIVFHLDRMNSLVAEQLRENIALLQAIHEANHKIVELEFQHDRAQRVRWTAQEDALLRYSAGAFGSDLAKIQAVMVSKTKKQIYFRILYQNRQQTKAE